MSDTTPEPARKPNPETAETEGEREASSAESVTAPATAPAASAAAEPHDADPDMANPPSSPVSARGHVNRPADAEDARAEAAAVPAATQATATAPAAAPAAAPAQTIEPEPVVSTDDDVAAAVARSSDPTGQPGATAAGSATVDTASPAQSATPVIVAAEAANLQAPPATTAASGTAPAGEATWAPEPAAGPAGAPATAAATVAAVPASQQSGPQPVAPIYLQRPEPPKKKSNRGVGILIALVGTVAFALLWAAAVVVVGSLLTPSDEFLPALLQFFSLSQLSGWAPIIAFFVGMVVLIQVINRSRWWAYILGGLVVAVFVYFVYVGAALVDAKYWLRTPDEFAVVLRATWVNPFAVLAGVIAREMTVWTGAWLAARGRKLKARNAEAQADYEQQLADAQNQAAAAYVQQGY